MRIARQLAMLALLSTTTVVPVALAQGSAFSRLADLHAAADIPTLEMASMNESWAGKCAIVDAPDQLSGGIEHFFLDHDSVLGDRLWAIETVYNNDETWPTRASSAQLAAERNRAMTVSSNYDQLAYSATGLTTRYYARGPNNSVEDFAYTLRHKTADDGTAYWITRVDCNLFQCMPLDGRGPILRRGDAVAYCYFNTKVLPTQVGN